MITIVTGLGRCGSSLVMQILKESGLNVTGKAPYYEADEAKISQFNHEWFDYQSDCVIKVLGLHLCKIKKGDYKIIYCYRDIKEQAQSQKKFYKQILNSHAQKKVLVSRIRKESKLCLAAAKKLGPTLSLKFEDFQNEPLKCIARICLFLNVDPEKYSVPMYNAIIKRTTSCMPDMRIERILEND